MSRVVSRIGRKRAKEKKSLHNPRSKRAAFCVMDYHSPALHEFVVEPTVPGVID